MQLRHVISKDDEQMRFYLRSQVFFAAINAIPGIFITFMAASNIVVAAGTFITTGFFWADSFFALGWFVYVTLAIYLSIQWISIDRRGAYVRLRKAPGLLSVLLWVIPFVSFVAVCVNCYLSATDDSPDLFNDIELNMYDFLALGAFAAIWFFIPAIFATLAYFRAKAA